MPVIMPIKDLRNTSEISDMAHRMQEPIFVTKNGYSDLVVMSSELYDKFARVNRIDQAIFESEKEMEEGGLSIDLDAVSYTHLDVYKRQVQYCGKRGLLIMNADMDYVYYNAELYGPVSYTHLDVYKRQGGMRFPNAVQKLLQIDLRSLADNFSMPRLLVNIES